MKLTLGQLREMIRDCWGGSHPDEMYELFDDPKFAERSTYVPDDIKVSIEKWATAMGLRRKSDERRS